MKGFNSILMHLSNNTKSALKYKNLIKLLSFQVYSDGSYASIDSKASQLGYCFLFDKDKSVYQSAGTFVCPKR